MALTHDSALEPGAHLLAGFSWEILTWVFKPVLGFCCTGAKDKWLPLSQELGEIFLQFTVVVRSPLTNQEPEHRQMGVLGSSYSGYPFRDGEKHISWICAIPPRMASDVF